MYIFQLYNYLEAVYVLMFFSIFVKADYMAFSIPFKYSTKPTAPGSSTLEESPT